MRQQGQLSSEKEDGHQQSQRALGFPKAQALSTDALHRVKVSLRAERESGMHRDEFDYATSYPTFQGVVPIPSTYPTVQASSLCQPTSHPDRFRRRPKRAPVSYSSSGLKRATGATYPKKEEKEGRRRTGRSGERRGRGEPPQRRRRRRAQRRRRGREQGQGPQERRPVTSLC